MTIVLIGFMGAGKTTLLQAIAQQRPDLQTVDLDQQIKTVAQKSITQIFAEEGRHGFRVREHQVLKDLLESGFDLIAAGGGIIEYPDNTILLANQLTIWIDTPFELCWQRIKSDSNRPIVQQQGYTGLQQLFEQRRTIYQKLANNTIVVQKEDTSDDLIRAITPWLQNS